MLTGIDRNGITIQLGCGFLRNEKTEGFVWLFTEFKKAMGGKDPANIITDQDIAMKAAIAEVFVSSVHRNCRWHIMENARKTMGAFLDSKGMVSKSWRMTSRIVLTIASRRQSLSRSGRLFWINMSSTMMRGSNICMT